MISLARWLDGIGLGKHAELFASHGILLENLPNLSDADLRRLKVVAEERRIILSKVPFLDEVVSDDADESDPTKTRTSPGSGPDIERRQVTVMFSDLVDYTPLSRKTDPEELLAIVSNFRALVTDAVVRFNGQVAQFVGDGIMAFFGWPIANEQDAERAIRASFSIIRGLADLPPANGEAPRCHIGIATGLVVIGEILDKAGIDGGGVFGETPNLAARLQSLAKPNRILISERTRELASDHFEYSDLGLKQIKGFDEPVRTIEVLREREYQTRFQASHRLELTPLVGRHKAMASLCSLWNEAKSGQGHSVLISGEAGVGKSRLLVELLNEVRREPHVVIRYQCSPFHTSTPLYPFIRRIEQAANINYRESAKQRAEKLENFLRQTGIQSQDELALIFSMISIELPAGIKKVAISNEKQKELTFNLLIRLIENFGSRVPVFIMMEDIHWADPSSLELIEQAIEKLSKSSTMIVITARSGTEAPMPKSKAISHLEIENLPAAVVRELVNKLTSDREPLAQDLRESIVARSDGNPLYVEELTKAYYETNSSKSDGNVPTALTQLLLARLDQLEGAKSIAQVCACIEQDFDADLIAQLESRSHSEVDGCLDKLVDQGILRRLIPNDPANYRFRHSLIRDAAYSSMLRSRRKQLHKRIAMIIERDDPNSVEAHPETLAYHYEAAGQTEQAIDYRLRSASKTLEQFANREAADHVQMAMELLPALPVGAERDRIELRALCLLAKARAVSLGYGSKKTMAAFRAASALSARCGGTKEYVATMRGLFAAYYAQADFDNANALGEQVLATSGLPVVQMVGYHMVGVPKIWQGHLLEARAELEKSLQIYDVQLSPSEDKRGEVPPPFDTRSLLSLNLALLGYPDQSISLAQSNIAACISANRPLSLANAYICLCNVLQLYRHPDLMPVATKMLQLSEEHQMPFFSASAEVFQGTARCNVGNIRDGLSAILVGAERYLSTDSVVNQTFLYAVITEAYLSSGDFDQGFDAVGKGLKLAELHGERHLEAGLYRLKGELLIQSDPEKIDEALSNLNAAQEIAQKQHNKILELRAAKSLFHNSPESARQKTLKDLAILFNWFKGDRDLRDVKETEEILSSSNEGV